IGVAAESALVYSLAGKYTSFRAEVGVDDEVGPEGTGVFQVFLYNVKKVDSGVRTGASATKLVSIDLTGARALKLVTSEGGDDTNFDHGDLCQAQRAHL